MFHVFLNWSQSWWVAWWFIWFGVRTAYPSKTWKGSSWLRNPFQLGSLNGKIICPSFPMSYVRTSRTHWSDLNTEVMVFTSEIEPSSSRESRLQLATSYLEQSERQNSAPPPPAKRKIEGNHGIFHDFSASIASDMVSILPAILGLLGLDPNHQGMCIVPI